ncbi:MAG: KOW domain-containing RNA-binding protein [Clostridia bacterium]|nr:KOW domain-containing RNA-binding protein [Clostridia bacterium]
MESHIAEVVYAIAGRDKGDCFIVTAEEENFLYLSDGKSRKVSNPKKKKIKHVSFTGVRDDFILGRITTTGRLTNKEVRYALSNFLSKYEK